MLSEHQGTESSTSMTQFETESDEDWEAIRVVVPENLSSGVTSAEEESPRVEERFVQPAGLEGTGRRSQRGTAGQHSNPFRQPRSVLGNGSCSNPCRVESWRVAGNPDSLKSFMAGDL